VQNSIFVHFNNMFILDFEFFNMFVKQLPILVTILSLICGYLFTFNHDFRLFILDKYLPKYLDRSKIFMKFELDNEDENENKDNDIYYNKYRYLYFFFSKK